MGGFFIRPKDTNIDSSNNHLFAEPIGVVADYDNEYVENTGFNSTTDGISGAPHRRDNIGTEPAPGSPLPAGGSPKGYTGAVRGWKGPVSKNVPSGFGKGTRAGNRGR